MISRLSDQGAHPSSFVELLRSRALDQPERRAYTFLLDGETNEAYLTYAALDRQARAIAALLQHAQVSGERALLLYPPGLDYIAAFFGCLYAGVVAVPTYPPRLTPNDRSLPRLRAVVSNARPLVALTTSPIRSIAEAMFAQDPDLSGVRWLATDAVAADMAATWRPSAIDGSSLALLQYTSGSTGLPKGVVLTHANLLHNSALIERSFGHTPASCGVIWLPPYHDMGLIGGILQPLYAGFPVVLMSPVDFLQRPLRWLQAITRYRATTSGGPNFAYDLCVRKTTPEQRAALDLSSWEVAFDGAEPIRAETLERFVEAFAPCGFRREAFYPCYGLAEATLIVAGGAKAAAPVVYCVEDAVLEQHRVSGAGAGHTHALVGCGWPIDQRIAIVRPDTLSRCAAGEVGEIWVAGPSVARGYWERPEETRQTFQAHLADTGEGPFLRTGDLGFVHDGELFITGRLKDLIIIRGRNLYPQDIELTVERSHAALRPGCGAAFAIDAEGEERLVVVQEVERQQRDSDVEALARAIREVVAEQHEVPVYVVALVKAGCIPKTSSGKIQRSLCRSDFLADRLALLGKSVQSARAPEQDDRGPIPGELLLAEPEARRSLLETYLLRQIAQVLRVDPAELDSRQSLIALGLDSLLSIDLLSRVEVDLGVAVPLEQILGGLSVAQLADQLHAGLMAANVATTVQPVHPAEAAEDRLLSYDQQRLWFLDQLAPGNPAYNLAAAYRLDGALNIPALQQSIDDVVRRHAALRTTFAAQDGRPVQVVAAQILLPLQVIDLSAYAEVTRAAEVQRLATAVVRRPFDLARGPLLRATLLRLGAREHVLLVVAHHIICDFWSVLLFVQEVAAHYAARAGGQGSGVRGQGATTPLPPPARGGTEGGAETRGQGDKESGVRSQESDVGECQTQNSKLKTQNYSPNTQHLAYWRERLAGAPALLALPTTRPYPATRTFRGATYTFDLAPDLVAALRELGRAAGATLFMTLLAAFTAVLARTTAQDDIVIGAPIAGRSGPQSQALIGLFAYPLVLRIDLSADPTFRELLARVRAVALEAYAHRDVPFAWVVEAARPERSDSYAPLVQVMFSFPDKLWEPLELPGLALQPIDVDRGAIDLDLFLTMVRRADGLHGVLEYSVDLFDAATIASFVDALRAALETAARQPDTRLMRFALPPSLDARAHEQQTIAVAATFTAEPIAESLAFWMRQLDIPSGIAFAPYNQVFQQLLAPAGLFADNRRGANVILVRFEDWWGAEMSVDGAPRLDDAALDRNLRDLIDALKISAQRSPVPHLVCVCPPSPATLADASSAALLQGLEQQLAAALDGVGGVHVATVTELARTYPITVTAYADPYADELGRIPYTPLFFAALGTLVARRTYAFLSPPRKVIVMDCDQLLWKGVCGEDGPLDLEIDPPRRALQEFMVAQHNAGMLLCLCSKNSESDVFEVFARRPEMSLKRDHLVAWRINWRPKPENLKALAEELRLGLDSFIFVDDSPVECAEVQADCPEVLTLRVPEDAAGIPQFLEHVWAFDHPRVTQDDRRRTALYRQNIGREQARRQALTLDDFLASLDLEVRVVEVAPEQVARAAQLTQRTNQFNMTAIRRSESELAQLCRSGEHECLVVEVSDRFGDYGMVGVMIFVAQAEALVVDTFLLSCRALGKRVEHHMLARLGAIARARGLGRVEVPFRPTARNQPAYDFLERVGAPWRVSDGAGLRFSFPAELAESLPSGPGDAGPPAEAASDERPDPASAAHTGPRRDAQSALWNRVAGELCSAERILSAIRAQRTAAPRAVAYAAPRTPTERQLALLWADFLRAERVGIHDTFFDLGGHSLLATQILSRVRDAFQVELTLRQLLFETPTIAGLAERIDAARRAAPQAQLPSLRPRVRSEAPPLSFEQERLWFLDQLRPGSAAYTVPVALRLAGVLDIAALRRSLGAVVRRHEALRTTFAVVDGRPVQDIAAPAAAPPMAVVDLQALPEALRPGTARRLIAAEIERPFDLSRGPLLRAVLLRLDGQQHTLFVTAHHIVCDFWSMLLLIQEIVAHYAADGAAALPELPIQYADFVVWQRAWLQEPGVRGQGSGGRSPDPPASPRRRGDRGGRGDKQTRSQESGVRSQESDDVERQTQNSKLKTQNSSSIPHPPAPNTQHLAYWKARLEGVAALELPTDRPRAVEQRSSGGAYTFELPGELVQALHDLSRAEGVTLFMALLAAFKIVLARYAAQDDIVVGSPIAGRTHPQLEQLIGFFAYPLVLRTDLSGDPTFREVLARVREVVLGAHEHQEVPLSRVVEAIRLGRSANQPALFQVMFSHIQLPAEVMELPGLTFSLLDVENEITDFDLFLTIRERTQGLRGTLAYNADLFDAATIALLARALCEVLAAGARNPDARLAQFVLPDELEARAETARREHVVRPRDSRQILGAQPPKQARPELEASFEPPRTPAEQKLVEIWTELLHIDRVGIHENFFDLGGHSLLATQLLSRVREVFDVELPMQVLFAGAFTVAELAKAIDQYQIEQAGTEDVAALLAELNELSDEEIKALLAEDQ